MLPLHVRPMDEPRMKSLSVDADSRLGMLFVDEAARGGRGQMEAATRKRGHGMVADVVASVDATVPCPLLTCHSRASPFVTAFFWVNLDVFLVVLDLSLGSQTLTKESCMLLRLIQ